MPIVYDRHRELAQFPGWYFGEVYGFETCRGGRGIHKREHVAAGGLEQLSDEGPQHCHAGLNGLSNRSLGKAPLMRVPALLFQGHNPSDLP